MKYLYTPYDLAIFFLSVDFTLSDERAVLHELWENDKSSIPAKYRQDETLLRRDVHNEFLKFDGTFDDLDELNLLMRDTGHSLNIDGTLNEQGLIESYFKIIKLNLTYVEGNDYRKIKLRRLLKKFGYQRRSAQLVEHIERTLKALSLVTYLRGYESCCISEIKIDDMVITRLKS